jgi:Zn-dependent peptidase ImmA (M78 family)
VDVAQFPHRSKKPDGMAVRVGSRYAIVLCRNHRYSAWPLFILAHELGHIARGHLKQDGLLVDDDNWATDVEGAEKEANDFAVKLLTGNRSVAIAALKNLETKAQAITTIRQTMQTNLDLERVSTENREFLLRVTGV